MSWCTIINHLRQSERSDLTPVELVWPCGRFIMQGQINWTWLQHRNKNHAADIYAHWIPAADKRKGRCWFACHSFEYNEMMSYFSAGWHSMTHSVPQMVLTMIQLSVAGQHVWANKTSYTLQSLFSYGKNQQPPHWTWFFFLPNDFRDFVCISVLTNQRQNSYVVGLLALVSPSMKHQFN